MAATATCPVCLEQFVDAPTAFALHVAACTAESTGAPRSASALATAALATPTQSCPTCHMVYSSALAPHEILFHEEECDRVNEFVGPVVLPARLDALGGASSGRPTSGGKRPREHAGATAATTATATTAAGPKATLFPANCAVCDAGGRTLLHCAGACARSFHPMCIDEINVARDFAANGTAAVVGASATTAASAGGGGPSSSATAFASAITRDKKAQKAWVCGECTRGLHTCQLCGFLGHEGHEIVRCSLPDCGFFFHPACLREQNHRAQSPLVCPRHTCTACHAIETDMTKCSSCTKCCTSIHLHCREATGNATPSQSRGRGEVLDPNFHVCETHKPEADQTSGNSAAITPERKMAQFVGLKMQTRPGDLVLILEYGNLLLPSTAKEVAPEVYNQWGIVQRVENLGDGISSAWWTQLLTVTLFSDNSSISVPNRYVLPVASMRQYSSPTLMIRDAIKWHAMCELQVRHLEKQRARAVADAVASTTSPPSLLASIVLAFKERANALGIPPSDRLTSAGDGLAAWQRFSDSSPLTYLATSAPAYIALDTRGQNKLDIEEATVSDKTKQLSRGPHTATDGDDDVDMEDAPSSSAQDRDTTKPSSAPTSSIEKTRSAATEQGRGEATALISEVMARLLEGVEALHSRGVLLGGSTDTEVDESTESLGVGGESMLDGDERDEDMPEVVELPVLQDEEESEHDECTENRLSMDDLLNPLSQEHLTMPEEVAQSSPQQCISPSPCTSPLEPTSKKEDYVKVAESGVDVTTRMVKRAFEPSKEESVDELDIMAKSSGGLTHGTEHVSKKMKFDYDMKAAVVVNFSHLPLNLKKPRSAVFGRVALPVRPVLLRKEKLAAEYPSVVLRDLHRKVDAFFEAEDQHGRQHLKGFPTIRPAFYRPTPFLYRSVRVGRRVDSISRVLLCQDKRNLKCFVRENASSLASRPTKGMRSCPYEIDHHDRLAYVLVDLLGISNFSTLEKQVRSRVASAVTTKQRSSGWHWQSSSGTSETVEEEEREPEIRLSYCGHDGSEHALPAQKPVRPQQLEWLCFCANVVHLTATVVQH